MRFSSFGDAVPGSTSQEVLDVQGRLIQLGYVLQPNGSYDAATSAAILQFRQLLNLPIVDKIDGDLITGFGMAGRPEYAAKFQQMVPGINVGIALTVGTILFITWLQSRRES